MTFKNLQTKKTAVVGLGIEGLSTAEYLLTHSIPFGVYDEKSFDELKSISPDWERVLEKLQKAKIPLALSTSG